MFRKDKLSVLSWLVLIIILSIPVVNVIFVLVMLLGPGASSTVKNFFIAYLILWALAFFGMFNGAFDNVSGLFG